MNISILHLSDLHIKESDSGVFQNKADLLAKTILGYTDKLDSLFIVISGDVAFSGKEQEYICVSKFLDDLKKEVARRNQSSKIEFIIVPGNHDCNFEKDDTVRKTLISNINEKEIDDNIINHTTIVQEDFFNFIKEFTRESDIKFINANKICWNQDYKLDNINIRFLCLNSSWMSRKNEEYGKLIFPCEYIKSHVSKNNLFDLTITVLHHPYNWFLLSNQIDLSNLINNNNDLIFSGHEHQAKYFHERDFDDNTNQIINGGIFHDEKDNNKCEFILLNIYPEKNLQSIYYFSYNQNINDFEIIKKKETQNFIDNSIRKKKRLSLREDFKTILKGMDYPFPHPRNKTNISLDELFVFPDLIECDLLINEEQPDQTNIKDSPSVIKANPKILIIGAEKSGKTALSRMLFLDFINNGDCPLLINGKEINSSTDREIKKTLKGKFEEEYRNDFDSFLSSDKGKRIIIVDDYEKIKLNLKYRNELLKKLELYSDRIILFGSESIKYEELLIDSTESIIIESFKIYHIQKFGYLKRSMLISKWFEIGNNNLLQEIDKSRQTTEKIVTNAIKGKLLPSLPFYILYIVSQIDNRDC